MASEDKILAALQAILESLRTATMPVDLDKPMSPAAFARWRGVSEDWVRKQCAGRRPKLPGVFGETPQSRCIHPRTYLAKAGAGRLVLTDGHRGNACMSESPANDVARATGTKRANGDSLR